MDAQQLLDLLYLGRLTVYPLGVASLLVLAIVFERVWRFRGIEQGTRQLTRESIEALIRRDVDTARSLCEKAKTPISELYLEAMRWQNIALDDLEGILATSRQELTQDLKRGLWVVGTIAAAVTGAGVGGLGVCSLSYLGRDSFS